MQISVAFRHLDSSDALRDYVTSKIDRLTKFWDGVVDAHVVLEKEKTRHRCRTERTLLVAKQRKVLHQYDSSCADRSEKNDRICNNNINFTQKSNSFINSSFLQNQNFCGLSHRNLRLQSSLLSKRDEDHILPK